MKAEELKEAGLPHNQAEVYLELTKRPAQSAGKIAKRLSIDRSFTYSILTGLLDKGLVSFSVRDGHRVFYPADPGHLLKEIEEKRARVTKLVEDLKAIQKSRSEDVRVEVYEGKSGLKVYARHMLDYPSSNTLGGGVGFVPTIEKLKHEYPHYLKEFSIKGFSGRAITSKTTLPSMKGLKGTKFEVKTLPGLTSPVSFSIGGKKLAIYSATEKPFVILIDGRGIAEALNQYFEHLWGLAKK